jgi:putative transposase
MRNPLKRHYGQGDLHFVTFSCYRRRPLLGTPEARYTFVKILNEIRCRHGFQLFGYVLMPEHVHLLLSEPKNIDPSKVLQVLKQRVSRDLHEQEQVTKLLSTEGADAETFWQRRFYDFNVWSAKKAKEKLEYMHANPVKRNLVDHPEDWPWSSWSHYAGRTDGLIMIDSLAKEIVE